jgi:nucleotide-binding universal stress UspA family protein
MKNLLLVLSTSRTSTKAVDFAVETAKKEKATLFALCLLEVELANEVFDRFSDIGFIGDRPSMQLSEAILKEYRQRGYEELGSVQIKAMEEGVVYEPLMEQGDYIEKTLEVIRDRDIDMAVVVRRKPSTLLRYFSRSVADELAEKAPCKVHVFED